MRPNLSHFALQLSAIIGLTTVSIAQTEERSELAVAPAPPSVVVSSDSKADSKPLSNSSPGILKKFEDWIRSTENLLEEFGTSAERKLAEIAKTKKQRLEAKGQMRSQAPSPETAPSILAIAPPAPTAALEPPTSPSAEISNAESFAPIAGDPVGETIPIPVLGTGTPEWVKNGLVLGDDHSLAISSTLMPELEQCREDLKSRMMSEVLMYLNKHVLEYSDMVKLPELTQEYVEKYWVKQGQVFDNIQDRPSGTYHQLWIGLHISSEQLAKVREWEKQGVREQRMKKAGVFGGIGVFAVALLSGAVGLLARREKAKLKG